ncbi:hypothetical protein [Nocardia pseudovaccinii]|uniref:hypothetical protein n=1 Tax=Nocardia pseudovaccinii TaxID=189540 RepID=UPI0007A37958|nr:hypothetical protein [Nocardia pseudovaccinii]
MSRDTIVTPPKICGYADIESAHEQMREHRACRIGRCVWKTAAYYTLVDAGRLAPQSLTPRERAAARGIEFPPLDNEAYAGGGPTAQTLRDVLNKLTELALPAPDTNSGGHE